MRFTTFSRSVLFLAICFLLHSCTIEKRHYLSGYHVEWNHDKERSITQVQHEVVVNKDNTFAEAAELNDHSGSVINDVPIEEEVMADAKGGIIQPVIAKSRSRPLEVGQSRGSVSIDEQDDLDETEKKRKQKKKRNTKRLGAVALICSILAWVCLVSAVAIVVSAGASAGGVYLLSSLAFICALNSFLMAIKVIRNTPSGSGGKKKKKKKNGRTAAIIAMAISGAYLILTLISLASVRQT